MPGSDKTNFLRDTSWTLFVDGENFAKRGQAILKGRVDLSLGPSRRDVYLWLPGTSALSPFFARLPSPFHPPTWEVPLADRAYYYTSTVSDEPEWTKTRHALRELGFEGRLYKRVQGQAKTVDIALATEALMLAAERRTDASVIFSGDGDFVPVEEAMKRLGQRVIVGAFAGSASDELVIAADDFVDLTPLLIESWESHQRPGKAPRTGETGA